MEDTFSSPRNSNSFDHDSANESGELESAFEFGLDFGLRASTPKMEQLELPSLTSSNAGRRGFRMAEDNVVLRIDNVPWVCTFGFRCFMR